MSEHHHHHEHREQMSVLNAVTVVNVGSCDTSDSVGTVHGEPSVGLALIGPIYGAVAVFGADAPDVQANALVNVAGAASIIAHLTARFDAFGLGPTLTAKIDQKRSEIRALMAQESGDE